MDEPEPLEAIGDLQVEVQALRNIVEFLLAQYAMTSDDPMARLATIQEKMESACAVVSMNAEDPEQTDLSERVNEMMVELIDHARAFVRTAKG
jgi:hypothetical protein